jgi:hypothetical protein
MALRHILRQPRDAQPLLTDDRSLIGLDLARYQAKQRALPFAIATQQAKPLSRFDLQIDLIEQFWTTERQADTAQTQQWHGFTRTRTGPGRR